MPIIETQLSLHSAPRLFQRFEQLVEAKHWRKRAGQLLDSTRRNAFLRDHYARDCALMFQLATCSELAEKHGYLRPVDVQQFGLTPALAFMGQVLSLLDGLPAERQKSMLGRVRGAFRNPDDMRALQLEFFVATHFTTIGHQVRYPELEPDHPAVQGATFDLLIEDLGTDGLAVECKAVSHDKGRSLHRASLMPFYDHLRDALGGFSNELRAGLAVVVTVPDQLPASPDNQRLLAARVQRQVIAGRSETFDDGVQVRVTEFDAAPLRDVEMRPDTPEARAVVDAVTGTRNRGVLVLGRRNVGALLVVVQSARDDSLMSAVFDTARAAARKQLSTTRAGLVLFGFDGIEAHELQQISQHDSDPLQMPTAARVAASRFLAGASREHIVGIGFVSRAQTGRDGDGNFTGNGKTYHFDNESSPMWHPDFAGLFRRSANR